MMMEASSDSDETRSSFDDVVCIATTSDPQGFEQWRSMLATSGITTRSQTVTVQEGCGQPRQVLLLYVSAKDEERAQRLVQHHPDHPIFPLAHLRNAES